MTVLEEPRDISTLLLTVLLVAMAAVGVVMFIAGGAWALWAYVLSILAGEVAPKQVAGHGLVLVTCAFTLATLAGGLEVEFGSEDGDQNDAVDEDGEDNA